MLQWARAIALFAAAPALVVGPSHRQPTLHTVVTTHFLPLHVWTPVWSWLQRVLPMVHAGGGIIPGGLVSWNLADMLPPRHAMYYAVTGDTFDGKRAVEIGLVNFSVPKAKLREEATKLAEKLIKLNPNVVRYTKEAIRAVRKMDDRQARDYLKSKQDSLTKNDKEIREQHGMKQFLDEKSYRPGLGPFRKVENV